MTALVLVLWLQGAASAASPTAVAPPPAVVAEQEGSEEMPWLKGVRLLLAVDNLLDSWQRVCGPGGLTPLTYQRGIVDLIGRTIRFSIRKTID